MTFLEKLKQFSKSRKLRIKSEDRMMWYEAMASVSSSQMSLHQALTDMEPNFRVTKHPMHAVVSTLIYRLRGGGEDVPNVMMRTIGTELMTIVPAEEAMLIRAGEQSSRVAEGFTSAAQMVASKDKMASQVLSLLRKPVGYIGALMLMLVFFHIELIPSYEKAHPRSTWPIQAQIMGWITDHIYVLNVLLLALLAAAAFFFIHVVPRWAGPRREQLDAHFPFNLIASMNGVGFLKSLAAYTGAGLPASVAIPEIGASGTPYMKWQCEKIIALMRQGLRLEEAIARLSIIPLRFHWIIAVYSKLQDASVAYNRMADSMTKEVSKTLEIYFGHVLGNVIFLILTAAVIFVWSTFIGIATVRG